MHLVDDDLVGIRHFAALQGLHAGDLNRPRIVRENVVRLYHAHIANAFGKNLLD